MSDITLHFDDQLNFDIAISGSQLEVGNDLVTSVLLSLFTNRRAEPDDVVSGNDRGGWWADTIDDYRWGSRRWLLERAKQTDTTLKKDRNYTTEALQWLINDGIADRVEISNEWIRMGMERMNIQIYKPDGTKEALQFDFAWKELMNNAI